MRRLRIILCLCAAVIGLGGLLSVLRDPLANAPVENVQPAEAYRMLYERSQQDFAAMEVMLASGENYRISSSLVFDEDGRMLGVHNSLGQPVTLDDQPDFAFDSVSYQMMLLTASNLPVTASYPDWIQPPAGWITRQRASGFSIIPAIWLPSASVGGRLPVTAATWRWTAMTAFIWFLRTFMR